MNENKENKEMPVLDFDELVDYIKEKSDYTKEIIEDILNLETDYMVQLGIISIDWDIEWRAPLLSYLYIIRQNIEVPKNN